MSATTKQRLTLMQRAVLHRLREEGFPALADCASDSWSVGNPCLLPVAIDQPVLLHQYDRANGEMAPRA